MFGTPQVSNAAWATLFDSQATPFMRVSNKHDAVPTLLHPSSSARYSPHEVTDELGVTGRFQNAARARSLCRKHRALTLYQ
jgi:hypothetical protein